MLSRLYIKNYALIEELEVLLDAGFTVITGETGAGKSILMGALSLLGGKRADTSVLRNADEKCIVEGTFLLPKTLHSLFEKWDVDFQDENIFRREIAANGKSRAFINDTPVNLDILKEISSTCFDIHSQHEVFLLASAHFRMDVCDAFAEISEEVNSYTLEFNAFAKDKKEFLKYVENAQNNNAELDYKKFLFNELEEVNYQEGEQLLLEDECSVLTNSEELLEGFQQIQEALTEGETNALQILQSVKNVLSKLAKKHSKIDTSSDRLQSLIIDLKDVSDELDTLQSDIQPNPERLFEVENRLSVIFNLLKKHKLNHADELIILREELSNWLNEFSDSEAHISAWENKLSESEKELRSKAEKLSKKRKAGAESFAKKVESILHDLAMPHAQFIGEVKQVYELNEYGLDEVHFWFTANKGSKPVELHKSASGGEMSRVMLAIKSVIASKKRLPAIVFDEIDTGISGRVADMAGQIMVDLSKKCQVIAITHLPQIAAKGNSHFKVLKTVQDNSTKTQLLKLNTEYRIEELAAMMSGEELSTAALQNAKELLGLNS